MTTLRDLTEDEYNVIALYSDLAYSICKKYVPEFEGTFTATLLSQVFALWLADETAYIEDSDSFNSSTLEKPNKKMIELALGSAYGEVLNTEFKSDWKHITDEYGQEICIRHENPEYTTFPYTIVQKRIVSQETVFFEPIMATMKYNISKN
ncbi:DUF3806 domain-containing protein [Cellulophaga sp. Z1A5H]|uniref:DUF3806 domain-containing protein n=1 Tax=Cellulophaga sp. Z1A5H TaxID=2687291 RepID=UPI0013FDB871|nr:DUF3806 domain-containing protein [Cellulophaga sp. Z1A5H]